MIIPFRNFVAVREWIARMDAAGQRADETGKKLANAAPRQKLRSRLGYPAWRKNK